MLMSYSMLNLRELIAGSACATVSVRLWLGLLPGLQQLPQLWLQLLEGFLVCCQRLSLQISASFLQALVSAVTLSHKQANRQPPSRCAMKKNVDRQNISMITPYALH